MARKIKDFDADSYKTLDEFYAYLDDSAITLDRDHSLLDVMVAFRNKQVANKDKQRMQWEVEAFLFAFSGSTLFSFATASGPNTNELSEFPVLNDFQAEGFEYLKMRAAGAKNPFLKARYYHLLWKGQIKNKRFAKNAILAYIGAINASLLTADPEKGDGLIPVETWQELTSHFFPHNPLVAEYFEGKYPPQLEETLTAIRSAMEKEGRD